MDINQFKQKFINEAETLLVNFDNALLSLEKNKDSQSVNEAFRVMHTIKGASGMFGFEKIVEITHELESVYDLIRDNQLSISSALIELSFTAIDHIRALLIDESFKNEINIARHRILLESIYNFKGISYLDTKNKNKIIENQDTNRKATWNILFYPNDELIKRSINIIYIFQDLLALGEYKISNHPFSSELGAFWSIILITEQPFAEIENTLLFVLDYCKIIKIADHDIFDVSFDRRRHITEYIEDLNEPVKNESNEMVIDNKTSDIITNLKELKNSNTSLGSKRTTTHINVEASKLDTLMYLVSELVTTKSELLLALKKNNIEKAINASEKIEKLSNLFSNNALSIRMVSLREMLNRYKRLIRDLSKQLDKSIDFEIDGEDTELDKNIIDIIGEPILHLIRNCIDHGIESPEIRKAKGKPETGIIKFSAQKNGNYVFINISDDGNGINPETIYKKALEKGLISSGKELSESEIYNLIFLPGFSTAENLTNVSGRGVGMDIVLKKIQEIRGEVKIQSEVNKGTTFTLKLQQTVSIINTLLVTSGLTVYAIPVEDIETCLLDIHDNVSDSQNNLIAFENDLIPFYLLHGYNKQEKGSIDNEKLVIINKQSKRFAIVADTIIGEFQAVIKPLGKAFSEVKYLSGASLLGDGSIALLLDTDKLWFETLKN